MPRLIDAASGRLGAAPLVVRVGDVLTFAASGGTVRRGPHVVERLGPFLSAVVGPTGELLVPEGPPATVLFVARAPGRAELSVVTGDPWRTPVTTVYTVDVER